MKDIPFIKQKNYRVFTYISRMNISILDIFFLFNIHYTNVTKEEVFVKYLFEFYKKTDYEDLIRMALASYSWSVPTVGLSRIEFEMGLHPMFTGNRNAWEHTTGVYRLDGNVVAAVWNEGNYDGDVFFLFDTRERAEDIELLEDMIKFSKTYASGLKEDKRTKTVSIFVPDWHDTLKNCVIKHGFKLGEWEDKTFILSNIKKMEVCLPEGYTIIDGKDIPDFYLSNVHRMAFSYGIKQDPNPTEHGAEAFHEVRQQKHCKDYLTLCVLDKEKRPVGMTIIWYNPAMSYCEMEPLAVVWWERRKGIATALIQEAINRVLEKYPECKGITGGDQEFYKRMGFEKRGSSMEYNWEAEVFISWEKESIEHDYEKEFILQLQQER